MDQETESFLKQSIIAGAVKKKIDDKVAAMAPSTGNEHNIVSVSGGKDSTALLLLAIERETENLQAVFSDTGHEHPQTYEYIQYLNDKVFPIRIIKPDFSADIARKAEFVATKWREQGVAEEQVLRALAILKPTGNPFLDLCIWKGRFPSTRARFCSDELKRAPILEQVHYPLIEAGDDVVSWQGVRADESLNRRDLPERECKMVYPNGAELWNFRPILKWTAQDAFDMHKKHGVEPNPLYKQGMGRVGCMPCIHARKAELLEISQRFPEEIERVAEWERIVSQASKRGNSTFFAASDLGETDVDKAYEAGNILRFVEWAKTGRGGRQFDMFKVNGEQETGPLCTSIYGLCE
jgi:3'-phosphoadenosine 5'-phosphosulfate sulfotransferase (PAPS reductase)/FAD synthetase